MPNKLNIPDDIFNQLTNLCDQLSPENISCDGNATPLEIVKTRHHINLKWKALERKMCRRVSQSQIEEVMYGN